MHRILALIAVLALGGCGHPRDDKGGKNDEVVPDEAAPAVVVDDGVGLEDDDLGAIELPGDGDVVEPEPACDNVCADYPICFDLVAEKKISHVFIDFGDCEIGNFRVFALTPENEDFEEITDLEVTDELRVKGGPCHEIERDYVFGLHAERAKVCILFQDKFGEVRVGFHAGDVCEPGETKLAGLCHACDLSDLR
jgi:hypothetical protein